MSVTAMIPNNSFADARIEPCTGMRLLWIPPGGFLMGRDAGTKRERPVHRVRLSGFWLGETPVTNRQYARYLEATGHREPQTWCDRRFSDPEQPVVGVEWHEAEAFRTWLGEGADVTYGLPSEAQWEYAARGPEGWRFPWGDEEPTGERACFGLHWRKDGPQPVANHPAGRGPFGNLDLAGLVWEWCRDVWAEKAYRRRAGTDPLDPVVLQGDEDLRVLRGGSWSDLPADLCAAFRFWDHGVHGNNNTGFRIAAFPASTRDS